jgi:cytochrome oxidase assembly protein ShyY1
MTEAPINLKTTMIACLRSLARVSNVEKKNNKAMTVLTNKVIINNFTIMEPPVGMYLSRSLSIFIFFVFLFLSYWQYEKSILVDARQEKFKYAEKKNSPTFDVPPLFLSVHEGHWFAMNGSFHLKQAIVLDNQVYQNEVGYRWLIPFVSTMHDQAFLVDLGFVSSNGSRELPALPKIPSEHKIQGQLYKPLTNRFNDRLMPEDGYPIRIQALNLKELSAKLNLDLSPYIMRLESLPNISIVSMYKPIRMSSSKHISYALQWLFFALVWAVLMRRLTNYKDKS